MPILLSCLTYHGVNEIQSSPEHDNATDICFGIQWTVKKLCYDCALTSLIMRNVIPHYQTALVGLNGIVVIC